MDSDNLSREELEALVLGLSDTDVLRLKLIAEKYTGGHGMEAGDLLNEAIFRSLDAKKRETCPRNLPIVNFLAGVMRSITSNERGKTSRAENLDEIDLHHFSRKVSTPYDELEEKEAFDELEGIFENDEEISMLILHLQEDASPSEIQQSEKWSEKEYNTIRRRMRRKWNTHKKLEKTS